jgi:hypothetical protein
MLAPSERPKSARETTQTDKPRSCSRCVRANRCQPVKDASGSQAKEEPDEHSSVKKDVDHWGLMISYA